ncbi:MAG TPA: hypothetical protein VFI43_00010 [Nitrosospira sp.]|nr:hypothetical protein [Nitrosospira sp.]
MPKSIWEKAGNEARERAEQAKDFAVEANADIDREADSLLEKAKGSRFTGMIALGVIVLILLAVVF